MGIWLDYDSPNIPNMPLKPAYQKVTIRYNYSHDIAELCHVFFTPLYRGTNGPGGWAIREAEGNPNRTEYVWLFDVDLKVNTVSKSQVKGVQYWAYNEVLQHDFSGFIYTNLTVINVYLVL